MLDFLMTSRGVSAAPLPVADGEGAAVDAAAEAGDNVFGLTLEALTTDAESGAQAGADADGSRDAEEQAEDAVAVVVDAHSQVPAPVLPESDVNAAPLVDVAEIPAEASTAASPAFGPVPMSADSELVTPAANVVSSSQAAKGEPAAAGTAAPGPHGELITFHADEAVPSHPVVDAENGAAIPAIETAERVDIVPDVIRQAAMPATAVSPEQLAQTMTQAEVNVHVEAEGAARAAARAPLPQPVDAAPVIADEAAPQPQINTLPAPYYLRSLSSPAAEAGTADTGAFSQGGGAFAFSGGAHGNAPSPVVIKLAGASFTSALAGAPVDDALPSQTVNQIVQSLRMQWSRGTSEAHIRLEPHHFGEMRIAIRVEGGRVQARVEADAPVVREWLQTNHALLKTGLAEQHLSLEQLEIVAPQDSAASDRRDRQSQERDQSRPRTPRRRHADSGELFEVVA